MITLRRSVAAIFVGGVLALSTVAGAMAHHPGVDNPTLPAGGGETGAGHEMPQGPKLIACEINADEHPSGMTTGDGWGVFNAIEQGGMVHCERGE